MEYLNQTKLIKKIRVVFDASAKSSNGKSLNDILLIGLKLQPEIEKMSWKFNPPDAPHFGELWESGIKSVKYHIHRVVGNQIMTFEEFSTLLCQIEAILNSRPLTTISSDPNDPLPLTPGHFLTSSPLMSIPTDENVLKSQGLRQRWNLIQNLQNAFWERWHKEYLHTLIQRSKWSKQVSKVELNTVVIIRDLTTPLNWKLGVIIKLHPGSDGFSRVVTVRTSNGDYQRPIVKLCPLPISDDN